MPSTPVDILRELVAIDSVNPSLDAAGQGEGPISVYIENRCREAGLRVTRQSVFAGRDNLVVELDAGRPQTLLFESHMDTVPVGQMPDALKPAVRDGLMYGRGACDTKGTMAGMLWALEDAAKNRDNLPCNITLCCAVDEEFEARGIRAFVEEWVPAYAAKGRPIAGAVVGEPTLLEIVIAHKGVARFALTTMGKAAHSSVPHEGDSAISQMAEVLDYIRDETLPALEALRHPLCGKASLVVGTIRGGVQINIVPPECVIEIDRRLLPGETPEGAIAEFVAGLRAYRGKRTIDFSIQNLLIDPPLETLAETAVVSAAQGVNRKLGLGEGAHGASYGSDASKLGEVGIPTIVYGPGSIAQAHTASEWVELEQVTQAAHFYRGLMETFGAAGGTQ